MQKVIKAILFVAFVVFVVNICRLVGKDTMWSWLGHMSVIGILSFDANYKAFCSDQHFKKYLISKFERAVDYLLYVAIGIFCIIDVVSREVQIFSYANMALTAIAVSTAILHHKIYTNRLAELTANGTRNELVVNKIAN